MPLTIFHLSFAATHSDQQVKQMRNCVKNTQLWTFDRNNIYQPPVSSILVIFTVILIESNCGGARGSGSRLTKTCGPHFLFKCSRIFLITTGSSIQAIILTAPLQRLQRVTSILKTRLNRCAHVISLCFSTDGSLFFPCFLLTFPHFTGVTSLRCLLLGANTPW